ncbi:MAG: ABC transporter permease [Gaiellaceae bacterium]
MSFLSLVFRNLFRQRMRTTLTVVGISVGITIVIALGAITGGLKDTAGAMIREGGADFMVAQKGSADFSFSTVSEDEWAAVIAVPGVKRTTGVLVHITRVGSNPFFPLLGVRLDQLAAASPEVITGRLPIGATEVILGEKAAAATGVAPGESIEIEGRALDVVGIYRAKSVFYSGGAYAPLATVREIARKPDVVTAVYVTADAGVDPVELAAEIDDRLPSVTTVSSVSEYGKIDQGIEIMDALQLAVSILAILLGAIAVMNTMIMAVFERTREFGILRAVGWRGSRIVRLVLTEAVILCLVAAVVGIAFGLIAVQGVLQIEAIRNFLEPTYAAEVFVRGVVIAVSVGLAGALYPAYRAVRLSPMEALRHE